MEPKTDQNVWMCRLFLVFTVHTGHRFCCATIHFEIYVTGEEKAHGPTETLTQDLSHTVRTPLSYRATRSTCDNFPLLRFVPESAQNHAETDETVLLLLAARARTHTGHQMSLGRKKHMARPGLEPRTSRIPYTLTTELPSHTVDL